MKKKVLFIIFFMMLFVGYVSPVSALEYNIGTIDDLTASKEAIKDENLVGEYDINISLPGKNKVFEGVNVLIITDASFSTDEEWSDMRASMLATVNALLPNTDSSKNINKVGLMSFGVSAHLNIPLTSDPVLFEQILPTDEGGSLLQTGRSATNIEGGLRGAYNYLTTLGVQTKSKENTYVILLTDGEANFNEIEINWYQRILGNNNYLKTNRGWILKLLVYADNNKELSRPDFVDNMINYMKSEYVKGIDPELVITDGYLDTLSIESITDSLDTNTMNIILDDEIKMLYEGFGYDINKEYSISEYEDMFGPVTFIDNKEFDLTFKSYMFYDVMNSAYERSVRNATRIIDQGNILANYATIYTIGYNTWRADALKILDPNYIGGTWNGMQFTANNSSEHYSSGYFKADVSTINEKLDKITSDIISTKYNNPVIVDYTSKWVNPMDINGDGLFNEDDIVVKVNGEIVTDVSIKVEKLTKEEILSSDDPEVNGNSNGDIYKITWIVSEGNIKVMDKYQLSYRVKVDTQEYGFVSGYEYKANGNTTLTYEKLDNLVAGEEIASNYLFNIEVPVVSQLENVIVITKTDEEGNVLAGADFEVVGVNKGDLQIKKQYSIDGVNWTDSNIDNKATYFKFSGMYDFEYLLKEIQTPDGYIKAKDIEFDYQNKENNFDNEVVVNRKKDSVPKTMSETNYKISIGMSLLFLLGMISSSEFVKKRISSFKKKKLNI